MVSTETCPLDSKQAAFLISSFQGLKIGVSIFLSYCAMLFLIVAIFIGAFLVASVLPPKSRLRQRKRTGMSNLGLTRSHCVSDSDSESLASNSAINVVVEKKPSMSLIKLFYSSSSIGDKMENAKLLAHKAHEYLASYGFVSLSDAPSRLDEMVPAEIFLPDAICIFFIDCQPINDSQNINRLYCILEEAVAHTPEPDTPKILNRMRYGLFCINTDKLANQEYSFQTAANVYKWLRQLAARQIIRTGMSNVDDNLEIIYREWMMDLVIAIRIICNMEDVDLPTKQSSEKDTYDKENDARIENV